MFLYARGQSSKSNSSGESESSEGSFFSRTRYCRKNRIFSVEHLKHHYCNCHYDSPHLLLLTILRCRALLKSICSNSSSNLRCTSCGLKCKPWMCWTEPHAHRNSNVARRARSCWARWSSANRLFAPEGGQNHDSSSSDPPIGWPDNFSQDGFGDPHIMDFSPSDC